MLADQQVLLVEDEAVIGLELAALLRSQGAHVIGPVRDVGAALSHIQSTTIDCAVLDIQLVSGQDTSAVADLLAHAGVPFVFVTAHDSHDVLSRHPSQPVVTKPYDDRDIIAALRTALESK